MISEQREHYPTRNRQEFEKLAGARGGELNGIRIHSVRLPGFVAHQEVIFGGVGQSLSIRHDSIDRVGFMPGVVMTVKKVMGQRGLIYGLEKLL
jgi:4-hydroxy-tetrahydrodipicolinate reductase